MLLIPGTGNGERGTGNGERGTGNGERGTGNGERVHSGNPYKNSKWRTKTRQRAWEPVLSTRSSNSMVGANNMDGKCSVLLNDCNLNVYSKNLVFL